MVVCLWQHSISQVFRGRYWPIQMMPFTQSHRVLWEEVDAFWFYRLAITLAVIEYSSSINTHLKNIKRYFFRLRKKYRGFPGGAVVENLPANAGDAGSSPACGKIPHAAEQLSPWATTTEPARLEPVLHNGRGRDSERPAHHDEEWPPACRN